MKVKIYEINRDRDVSKVKHRNLDELAQIQGTRIVNPSIYDKVFRADMDEFEPDEIYGRFSFKRQSKQSGNLLSDSDVVVTENGAYYCSDGKCEKINFDESQANKPDEFMRVVYVEPNRSPYEAEIAHTLGAEQKAVGGYIECLYNEDDTAIVCNEEGKLIGMPGNRKVRAHSIIAGR